MSQVWKIASIGSTDKLVLLALADNANDAGVCWPSIARIALKSSLSERGVQASIARLRDAGHLSITERNGRSNLFTITPAADAPPQHVHPAADAPHPRTSCTPTPAPGAPTPAPGAPITIKESSFESSGEPGETPAPEVPRGTIAEANRIHAERMLELKAIYPKAAREGWITAERSIRRIIEGGVTWDALIAGVKRYRKHCDAENRPASDPARWFADENMPWNMEWAISKRTPRGAIAPAAGPSNEAAWAEAHARAKAIGFRLPLAIETPASYTTAIKLAENARPAPAVAERLGLAGLKRVGAR